MAYPESLAGKYIDYELDMGSSVDLSSQMIDGVVADQTATATVTVYSGGTPPTDPSDSVNVTPTCPPLTFTWLSRCAGYVTTVPVTGTVLTGPMTDGYLCRFTRGSMQVGHIGAAEDGHDPGTIRAKKAWLDFIARDDVVGAAPTDYFSYSELQAATLAAVPTIVGCFTSTKAYSLLLAPVRGSQNPKGMRLVRVAGVKQMTLQPWTTIAAMRRFRV